MKLSNFWNLIALLLPITGTGADLDELKARHAADADLWRRAALVAEANAPGIVTGATTQTVVTARDAYIVTMESNYLALATAAGLKGKTVPEADAVLTAAFEAENDSKKAGRIQNLAARIEAYRNALFREGIRAETATARTHETNTVVTIERTTPAMQRLGRPATEADFK